MARRTFSHVVGFDDGSFDKYRHVTVPVVGVVFSGLRLEGVLCGRVRTDGANATRELVRMVAESKFAPQLQLVLLQGIAEAVRCVMCLRTGEWPERLHDVEETETMLLHAHEDETKLLDEEDKKIKMHADLKKMVEDEIDKGDEK